MNDGCVRGKRRIQLLDELRAPSNVAMESDDM